MPVVSSLEMLFYYFPFTQNSVWHPRVPIGRILFLLKDGYTLEAIREDYPHIDLKTLSGAVDEAIEAVNTRLHAKTVL